MMRLKLVSAVVALGFLAGCVGSDIEAMRTAEGTGSAFTRALTEEYRQITLFEADEMYDWQDAGYFARKGLRAAAGEVVEPEVLANWDLPADKVDELASARARLVSLLDASAREKAPQEAARAQGRFDCWVEQQEENHQPDHIAACRDEFYAALAALEEAMKPAPEPMMPKAQPEPFVVFFAFDSAALSDEAESVINAAVAAAQDAAPAPRTTTRSSRSPGPTPWRVPWRLAASPPATSRWPVAARAIPRCRRPTAWPSRPTAGWSSSSSNPFRYQGKRRRLGGAVFLCALCAQETRTLSRPRLDKTSSRPRMPPRKGAQE